MGTSVRNGLMQNNNLANNLVGTCMFKVNLNLKNFMAPFYEWGSTASRLEPLRGGSLLFTTKFPEIPGTSSYRF